MPQEKGKHPDMFSSSTLVNCTHRMSKIYPMHRCSAPLDNFDDVWAINSIRTISFTPTVRLCSKSKCHRRSLGENFPDVCLKEPHKPLWFAGKNVTEYHTHSGGKKNHSYTYGTSHCKWIHAVMLPLSCGAAPEHNPSSLQQEWHQWKLSLQLAAGQVGHRCYSHSTTVPHVCLECWETSPDITDRTGCTQLILSDPKRNHQHTSHCPAHIRG